MKKIKIFTAVVLMILIVHNEKDFISNFTERPVVGETQFEGRMLTLSRDRIVIKRRRYKGRRQYRRFNATKKKRIDARWRNY